MKYMKMALVSSIIDIYKRTIIQNIRNLTAFRTYYIKSDMLINKKMYDYHGKKTTTIDI